LARSPFDEPTVERLLAHVEPDPVSDGVALVIVSRRASRRRHRRVRLPKGPRERLDVGLGVACVLTEDAAGCYNVVALANRR
jgi:hypothetical protein